MGCCQRAIPSSNPIPKKLPLASGPWRPWARRAAAQAMAQVPRPSASGYSPTLLTEKMVANRGERATKSPATMAGTSPPRRRPKAMVLAVNIVQSTMLPITTRRPRSSRPTRRLAAAPMCALSEPW